MSKITEVQKKIKEKKAQRLLEKENEAAFVTSEKVEINTYGEIVRINGYKFYGKMKVPKEYAPEITRIVEARKAQDRKNKEFLDHGDKRGIVFGKAFRN